MLNIFDMHWPIMALASVIWWLSPFGLKLPSPTGMTDLQHYALHGPVQAMRGEEATFKYGVESKRTLTGTAVFDTHGYVTDEVQYLQGKLHITNTNNYDDKGRLAKQERTLQLRREGEEAGDTKLLTEATYTYDDQGRMSAMHSHLSLQGASTDENQAIDMGIANTFDGLGRVAEQTWKVDKSKDTSDFILAHRFTYRPNGAEGTILNISNATSPNKSAWTRYNAQGDVTESRQFDEHGTVSNKAYLLFTPEGALQRTAGLINGKMVRQQYGDYVYDAHGNWTKRICYEISEKDGKEVLTAAKVEYRMFSYYTEKGKE